MLSSFPRGLKSGGDSFFSPRVSWPPSCRRVEWLLRVVFCTDVTTGGLGKVGPVGGMISGGLLAGMSNFGEGFWCQVNC